MFRYQKILVPLDGSDLAEEVMPPTVAIAEAMAAEIVVLQVVTGLTLNLDPYLNQRVIKARERAADLYLNSLQYRFSKAKVKIDISTTAGPAARTIINYAKYNDIDLMAMSSHGLTGLNRWVFGNVAIKILRHAQCDTLMFRPLADTEPFSNNRILVPLDGSQLAEQALKPALGLASALDLDILLLRVSPPLNIEQDPKSSRYMLNGIEAKAKEEAREYLQNVQATLTPLHRSGKVEAIIGTPAATIVDYANEQQVNMIVMSSHGRTGAGIWLMGSVSEKVLRKATCPTLIVRTATQT